MKKLLFATVVSSSLVSWTGAAEKAASAYAEQNKHRHIPFGEGIVSVVRIGDASEQKFMPFILNAEGNIVPVGDGMALSMLAAMRKAAEIALQQGLTLLPPLLARRT